MKQLTIVLLGIILTKAAFSQNQGILFENNLTWKQVVAKAKKENKSIFVDCGATWCAPCTYMNKKIFTAPAVGTAMNAEYISIELQMDSTKNDSKEVKNWYAKAREFEKEYAINSFPTYLFFNSKGEIMHKATGAYEKPEQFLALVKTAEDPGKQYYTLLANYKAHATDSSYLLNTIAATLKTGDRANAATAGDLYLDCIKNPFLRSNITVLLPTLSTNSNTFRFYYDHMAEADTSLGINSTAIMLAGVVSREEVLPLRQNGGAARINWDDLYNKIKGKYPPLADRVVLPAKFVSYKNRKIWKEYGLAVGAFMRKFIGELNYSQINDEAYDVFQYCDDPELLNEALGWSRLTIQPDAQGHVDMYSIDTYASLLYKTGNHKDAITWEQKALSLSVANKDEHMIDVCRETIQKMQAGGKIWK